MLKLNSISKTFKVKKITLNLFSDFNLTLPSSGLVLVQGKSGSGKTTLLNIITGLETPSKGYISYNGKKIKNYEEFRRNHIYYVSQNVEILSNITLEENIRLVLDDNSIEYDEDRIISFLSSINLNYELTRKASDLSVGERARFGIALAVISSKDILVFDEPTANLDITNATIIKDLLNDLSKDKLVIVSSHDKELFKSDKIITIENGKINGFDYQEGKSKYQHKTKNISLKRKFFTNIASLNFISFLAGIVMMVICIYLSTSFPNVEVDCEYEPDAYFVQGIGEDLYYSIEEAYNKGYIDEIVYEERSYSSSVYFKDCSQLTKHIGVGGYEAYSLTYLNGYDVVYGRMPQNENEVIIGKKLADKLVSKSDGYYTYDKLMGTPVNLHACIVGISAKETNCVYTVKSEVVGKVDQIYENFDYGSLEYEEYNLVYGEAADTYPGNSIILVANEDSLVCKKYYDYYYNSYKDTYANVGIVELTDGNPNGFEYLTKENYAKVQGEVHFKTDVDNIRIVEGRAPQTNKEIVVNLYTGLNVGDSFFGKEVVGLCIDSSFYNVYLTNDCYEAMKNLLPLHEDLCSSSVSKWHFVNNEHPSSGEIIVLVNNIDEVRKLIPSKFEFCNLYQDYEKRLIAGEWSHFYNALGLSTIILTCTIGVMLLFDFIWIKKNKNNFNVAKLYGYSKGSIIRNFLYHNRFRILMWIVIDVLMSLVYLLCMKNLTSLKNIYTNYFVYIAISLSFIIEMLVTILPVYIRCLLKIRKS